MIAARTGAGKEVTMKEMKHDPELARLFKVSDSIEFNSFYEHDALRKLSPGDSARIMADPGKAARVMSGRFVRTMKRLLNKDPKDVAYRMPAKQVDGELWFAKSRFVCNSVDPDLASLESAAPAVSREGLAMLMQWAA